DHRGLSENLKRARVEHKTAGFLVITDNDLRLGSQTPSTLELRTIYIRMSTYSLGLRKDLQSTTSSVFEIQDNGVVIATLRCYFAQSQTPADLTIGRWLSIVFESKGASLRSYRWRQHCRGFYPTPMVA